MNLQPTALLIFLTTIQLFVPAMMTKDPPIPIVMWHGLSDSSCGLLRFKGLIESEIPGVYIFLIKIGKTKQEEIDNSFLMNANKQVKIACAAIKNDTKLRNGFHGVGWSQAFETRLKYCRRAVGERCPNPPMLNYISMGGPQQGVFGIPKCPAKQWLCKMIRNLFDIGVYTRYVQSFLVQAEYWHDPYQEELYRRKSIFLADINNEETINQSYKKNFLSLQTIVLVKFTKDETVIPRESEWFEFYAPGQSKEIQKFNETRLFADDRIGLKEMYQDGKVYFIAINGFHIDISDKDFINKIVRPFLK